MPFALQAGTNITIALTPGGSGARTASLAITTDAGNATGALRSLRTRRIA